jgi:hypothetical protein
VRRTYAGKKSRDCPVKIFTGIFPQNGQYIAVAHPTGRRIELIRVPSGKKDYVGSTLGIIVQGADRVADQLRGACCGLCLSLNPCTEKTLAIRSRDPNRFDLTECLS